MPKKVIDYSRKVIYKLVCNDDDIEYLYVGSTTDFTKRKAKHKSDCNNTNSKSNNEKKYVEIRANGGWVNFTMFEIEKYPCLDNNEARAREEVLRKELKANMNMRKAFTSDAEKKQYYKVYNEVYRTANKEQIATNSEVYRTANKEQIKTLREANKDKLNKYNKEYRTKNKEQIKAKNSTRHECPCGGRYTTANKARHEQSKGHQQFINGQ